MTDKIGCIKPLKNVLQWSSNPKVDPMSRSNQEDGKRMKIVCEVCRIEGYLQHVGKNYHRVRHYVGLDSASGKPKFQYHKRSLAYIKNILDSNCAVKAIDPIDPKNIDLKLLNDSSIKENMSGRSLAWPGHRPPTPTTRVQIPATASAALD